MTRGYRATWSPDALAGRVCVVTGASGGIGLEATRALASVGGQVFALTRNPDRLTERLGGGLAGVRPVKADASRPDDVRAALAQAAELSGKIDVAVANAGQHTSCPFGEMPVESWRAEFEVNVHGAFVLFQSCLPHVPSGGSLIAVGSVSGVRGAGKGKVAYGATKAALNGFIAGLARELGPQGIRANVIAPGAVQGTEMADAVVASVSAESFAAGSFLGRAGDVWEAAHGVLYLATEASSYVTGSVLRVDGGSLFRDRVGG
ncbi:MAG: SDR family NAD(P)-dependent oxidoreductase [Micromonosporaceae bacterium]